MSKYRNPVGGAKRSSNLFYRSGINSLLSRLEKLEHQVHCCGRTKQPIHPTATGSTTIDRESSGEVILWNAGTDADLLTLPTPTKGMNFKIILEEDVSDGIVNITSAGADGDGYFWGQVLVFQADAVDQSFVQIIDRTVTKTDFTHLQLDSNGTATGGKAGDIINLICIADGAWYVDARLTTTGTLAKAAGTGASGSFFTTSAG